MMLTGNSLVPNSPLVETRQLVKPNQKAYPSQAINVVRQTSGSHAGSVPESVAKQTSTNSSGSNVVRQTSANTGSNLGSPWPSSVVNIQSPRLQTRSTAYPG